MRVADLLDPPNEPEMVTFVEEATEEVLTVKFADVAPAPTVTLAGTVAAEVLLLERETTAPPVGAAEESVTVPCEELPPVTELGFTETADSVAEGGSGLPLGDPFGSLVMKSLSNFEFNSLPRNWTVCKPPSGLFSTIVSCTCAAAPLLPRPLT